MVRGKIQMKKIENETSRQVTFTKRRKGLLKKAYELSVLCDAEVGIIVFSQRGRLFEFSSTEMQKTVERYGKYTRQSFSGNPVMDRPMQQLKQDAECMAKKIELLEFHQRRLLGQGLNSCSIQELEEIRSQLEKSLCNIRATKRQLSQDQTQRLKAKETALQEGNAGLYEEGKKLSAWPITLELLDRQRAPATSRGNTLTLSSVVETDLFIGLPENGSSCGDPTV